MQLTLALASAAFFGAVTAVPQGVTEELTPAGAAPAGCTGSFDGKFEITVAKVTKEKRSIPEKRAACGSEGTLVVTLEDGTALDGQGRTGYIASNYQFQFDAPAQAGALFTSGFSVCEDNILALGSSKTFYQCLSGDFYNLYDRTWAPQCEPISLIAIPCGSEDSADEAPDGQVIGTTVIQTTIVTAIGDGQAQVITTTVPVPIYSTYVPVSEHSDGQIQVTTTASVPQSTVVATPIPLPSATETKTATAAPPPPPETTPFIPSPTASSSAPASSSSPGSSSSSSSVEAPTLTTPVASPSTSSAPAPPASTSAPPESGSSNVAAGSMGALVVGMLVAFLCL